MSNAAEFDIIDTSYMMRQYALQRIRSVRAADRKGFGCFITFIGSAAVRYIPIRMTERLFWQCTVMQKGQ